MERLPPRRDLLLLGAMAGIAAVASACTASTGNPSSSGPSSTSATSAPPAPSGAPSSSAPTSSPRSVGSRPTRKTGYAKLAQQLSGALARPGQRSYKPQALLYNPRFRNQAKPEAIAYCTSAADVAHCVGFAAEGGAPLRVRNGGHSYGGWSSGPGLVIDLAAMNGVQVDRSSMTAHVGAGALLADVYSKLDAQGGSIGAGSCATVGVTGLTLGGGIGLLTRLYGLTCDQLDSAQVVTADARARTVSAAEHPDLFWALRGGGGSFAAVTGLTFAVRPAPRVQTVFLQWPGSAAADVLAAWQDWSPTTPRQLMSTCKILGHPGGHVQALIIAFWTGAGSADSQIRRLLKSTPTPATHTSSTNSYGAAMLGAAGCTGSATACITAALTPAQRLPEAAASSILHKPLPDKGIHAIVDAVGAGLAITGMAEGGVSFDALGGAVSDVPGDGTAFPWRKAIADIQYTATWSFDQATVDPGRYDHFVQKERAALQPYVGSAGYANYADPSLRDYATAYWGPNLPRLKKIKQAYDPHNVFSFPQSVPLT